MNLFNAHIAVVLALHAVGAFHVASRVLRGPPVGEVAARIEAPAAVVEAVRDLVPDHNADAAVIDRVIGFRVEEGRLQDARREDDLVAGGVVLRVHDVRRHEPVGKVHGAADAPTSRRTRKALARIQFST